MRIDAAHGPTPVPARWQLTHYFYDSETKPLHWKRTPEHAGPTPATAVWEDAKEEALRQGKKRLPRLMLVFILGFMARDVFAVDQPDFKDPALPFDQRVADLVKRFTLLEKCQQLQMAVSANARLGVPGCNWWTEGLHGVARNGRATVFPEAVGMSAAWDPDLLQRVAAATADEARAKYDPSRTGLQGEAGAYRGIIIWAPTINLDRDPRWGRSEETYGEDVCLTAKLGVAFCKGLQGDDPKYLKTVATPKHFAMHSQETGRTSTSFNISERTLREYYLPAFDACVHEGKAASIMTAYSGINGVPCTVNSWLCTELLRNEWHFDGAVASDFIAPSYLVNAFQRESSYEEACADAINAGVDVLCDHMSLAQQTANAVNRGLLKETVLDRALSRNLMLRFRLGMFDPPDMLPFPRVTQGVVGSKEHMNLALQMAHESIVLLKNDEAPKGFGFEKLLPIDLRRVNSIAVLGPYANVLQFGNYSGFPANVAPSPFAAIRDAVGDRVIVRTAEFYDTENSIKAAAASDMAIVVVGLNEQIEFEGIDRRTLDLPANQRTFLEKIVKANPLTIVVMEGGGPIGCTWLKEHVPAILMAWYPGEQGGCALADVLLGQTNPSGKLPVTFYRAVEDLPPLSDYEISRGRTYMYLQKQPCYPFGFGLSYTTFSYSNLRLPAAALAADGRLTASVDVTNSGKRDGDTIVQLYVHKGESAVTRPIKQLKAFQRITLTKGQTRTVTLTFPVKDLAYWDEKTHGFVVEPGAYDVMIGDSSSDIQLQGTFQVK
jgi:beta-glucosidase